MSDDPSQAMTRFPSELAHRFAPERVLGVGGMGAVLLCRDRELGRRVAIKLLAGRPEGAAAERFRREAMALAQLKHPHVVQVYGYGMAGESAYIVMELVEGHPLEETRREDPLGVLLRLAGGLDAVHRAGLIHRDVKPSNILLTRDGRAVLIDFGLARLPDLGRLTGPGWRMGTPVFMAPETLRGEDATPAADWWSFGATLYTMVEDGPPFTRESLMALAQGHGVPELVFRRSDPSGPAARVVRACLVERPGDRPAGARAIEALVHDPITAPTVITRRPAAAVPAGAGPRRGGWGVIGIAMVALSAWGSCSGKGRVAGTRAVAATPRLPEDLAERIRGEVDGLADCGLEAARPGNCADPDPAKRVQVFDGLPGLAAFRRYLREGGEPGRLAPRLRDELLALRGAFAGRGLGDPMDPWLVVVPRAEPPPTSLPPPIAAIRAPEGGRPSPTWMGAALEAREAAVHRLGELDRPGGLARGNQWSGPSLVGGITSLDWYLQQTIGLPRLRVELEIALRPGARELGRFVHAAARALRDDDHRTVGAWLAEQLDGLDELAYSWVGFEDPRVLLGGEPTSPAGALLAGQLAETCREVRQDARIEARELVGLEVRWWELALSGEPGRETLQVALPELLEVYEEEGRWGDAVRLHERFEAGIEAMEEGAAAKCLLRVARSLLETRSVEPDAKRRGVRVLGWLDTHGQELVRRGAKASDRATLEGLRRWSGGA